MPLLDVLMPSMGESLAEGTLTKWLKKVGDSVKRDETIFEISTDKVDSEVQAASAGILAEILVKEGETVPVNAVVARLETDVNAKVGAPSEPAAAPAGQSGKRAGAQDATRSPSATPQADGRTTSPGLHTASGRCDSPSFEPISGRISLTGSKAWPNRIGIRAIIS